MTGTKWLSCRHFRAAQYKATFMSTATEPKVRIQKEDFSVTDEI